ncbi:hypothetical protein HAX54_026827 [Datura stramonium]|uniref:Uncharacterized protein n=1 Tax=Datura stramonium TaxID=4076 RepID=A0ABS8V1L1_DATST|nr:hypothetical protein [Datura stramonium]
MKWKVFNGSLESSILCYTLLEWKEDWEVDYRDHETHAANRARNWELAGHHDHNVTSTEKDFVLTFCVSSVDQVIQVKVDYRDHETHATNRARNWELAGHHDHNVTSTEKDFVLTFWYKNITNAKQ